MKCKQSPENILRLYNNGSTQESIGVCFGITRQRVQQILKKIPGYKARIKKTLFISYICRFCGKEVIKPNYYGTHKYCDRKCSDKAKIKKPEDLSINDPVKRKRKRKRRAEQANWWYHNVLKKRKNWRDIIKERNNRARRKRGVIPIA
jgi:hypothetical protein